MFRANGGAAETTRDALKPQREQPGWLERIIAAACNRDATERLSCTPRACAHVRLSPRRLAKQLWTVTTRSHERHIGSSCACLLNRTTEGRYRCLQRGAVGHQLCHCGPSGTPPPALSGIPMPTGASTTSESTPARLGMARSGGRGR
jgi:hypothetical protein